MRSSYIYILASRKHGTLYIGVTSDLIQRIFLHKSKLVKSFSEKYRVDKLVYYEEYYDIMDAIAREKQLKTWRRAWKIQLIESENPDWMDLYYSLG